MNGLPAAHSDSPRVASLSSDRFIPTPDISRGDLLFKTGLR